MDDGGAVKRGRGIGRVALALAVFAVTSAAVLALDGVLPLASGFVPADGGMRLPVQVLGVLWWLALARLLVVLGDAVLGRLVFHGDRPRARKLVADVVSVLVYFAAFCSIVAYVFETPVTGLIAGSGVIAVVLGLALQNTLGDLFSGIALNIERPFRAGDWVTLGEVHGVVMETNWRATHLRTRTRDIVIVPNSTMARAQLVNHYLPTRVHGFRLDLHVDDRVPPDRVLELLRRAALDTEGVLADPAPILLIEGIVDGLTQVSVWPYIADYQRMPLIRSDVFARSWQYLNWAGIPVGIARREIRSLEMPAPPVPEEERLFARLLGSLPVFAVLSADECLTLARGLERRALAAGEVLIERGADGDRMFVVAEGRLAVRDAEGGVVARLGPGQPVGEMSLLTGAPRRNTVVAEEPAVVHVIGRDCLAPVLAARPALLAEFDRLVAQRLEAAGPKAEPGTTPAPRRVTDWFARVLHL